MSKKDSNKKKKEKIVYIDDGSTIFDMSGLEQTKRFSTNRQKTTTSRPVKQPSRWKAILQTYLDSVRMLLLPMLVFIGAICILFLILWFLF